MAYSRLLLLIVISSHLPGIQARPIDFWCNKEARKSMLKKVELLKNDMADCVGSRMLPAPLQLPCVCVQPVKWANQTLQQKRAEVLEALRVFEVGVHEEINQTTLECQTSLLKRLGHHITNLVGIVNSLQIQNDTGISSHPVVQDYSSETDLEKVLEHYGKLLKRKLELLANNLRDHLCQGYRRADLRQNKMPQA